MRKSRYCCDDDWVGNGTTTRRVLWTSSPSGKRQQDEQCPCDGDSRGGLIDDFAMVVAIVLLIGVVVLVSVRAYRRRERRQRAQEAARAEVEMEVLREKSRLEKVATAARDALVDADDTDGVCPVCLDTLLDDAVRGPNCRHAFHRACVERWIDTAVAAKADQRQSASIRALTCPTCSVSLLPADDDNDDDESLRAGTTTVVLDVYDSQEDHAAREPDRDDNTTRETDGGGDPPDDDRIDEP